MSFLKWLCIILIIVQFQIPLVSQEDIGANVSLHSLFKEISNYDRLQNKSGDLNRGKHPDRIGYQSLSDFQDQLDATLEYRTRLLEYREVELSGQDRISLETMALKLSGQIDGLKYKNHLIPFNAEGGFFNSMSSVIKRLPFESASDFEAYINWLPTYSDYLKAHVDIMRQGIHEGILAPKVIVNNTIRQIEPLTKRNIDRYFLTQMLKEKPESISTSKWVFIKNEILKVLEDFIWPSYDDLYRFMKEEYFPRAYDTPGISNIPNGEAYYNSRIAYFTTLDMTADEVFNTGLSEVKRIRKRMEDIIQDVAFKGTFAEFLDFLRTDKQFYAATPQQLLSYASWLSKKAEGQLPKLFSHLYELPFTVEPVPEDIAPTYTGGRYVQGNREQDRPGIFWVNTYNLPARSLYNLPALTVHEAVPGHHLQIMISAELKNLPSFRNRFYISAFGEGWGLYSEYLGEEMGMYVTPYDRFGRYTYEMWRACRLVVDVGLHTKGWTREQAVDYLASNTALSLHEVNTEIDRYIGWPGQAVSYKIGELTIKDLRSKAEKALGNRFDIKEFHYRVLRNGSIPLPTLIREIDEWVDEVISN